MTAHRETEKPALANRVIVSDDVLLQEVDGEAVLLDLKSEQYFGLNAVGTRLWQLLGSDASLQRAYSQMLSEYEVAPEQLESDLCSLAGELADAGLVTFD